MVDPFIEDSESSIFYIGKGTGKRLIQHFRCDKSNHRKVDRIKNIRERGKEPIAKILIAGLTEQEAYDTEVDYIKKYGRLGIDKRGILTNLAIDSRRPPSREGSVISDDQKRKIGNAARRRLLGNTYETLYGPERAAIVRQNVGRATRARAANITQETRERLSRANSRSYVEIYGSEEEAARQAKIRSDARKGKKRTEEQRERMKAASPTRGKPARNAKKVMVDGVMLPSVDSAMKHLHITPHTFYNQFVFDQLNNHFVRAQSI